MADRQKRCVLEYKTDYSALNTDSQAEYFKDLQAWRLAHKKALAKDEIDRSGRLAEMVRLEKTLSWLVCSFLKLRPRNQ